MKVNQKNLHKIIDIAKGRFINQPLIMYWKDDGKEITFEEKRIIAILESASLELKLDLEIEYKADK